MQTLPLMPYLNPMRLVLASRLLCTGNSEPRPKIVAETDHASKSCRHTCFEGLCWSSKRQ